MLTATAEPIARLVRNHGRLILSGFDHSEVDAVRGAFSGFAEGAQLAEENWIALLLHRP